MGKWKVGIFGPPETVYQGGYFKAELRFPSDYPLSPPNLRFLSPVIWHPNVYPVSSSILHYPPPHHITTISHIQSGEVCISILHTPGHDAMSGEHADERWNPTQSVRTILLSVISLLSEPNISSPANVDASLSYRKWCSDGEGDYLTRVTEQVELSKGLALQEGVTVPESVEAYCAGVVGGVQGDSSGGSDQAVEPAYYDDSDYDYYEENDDDGEEYGTDDEGGEDGDGAGECSE